MELTARLLGLRQFRKSEVNTEEEPDIVEQIRECEMLLRRNESLFNLEQDQQMIDAHIYEREALMVRYSTLLRRARAQGRRVGAAIEE
ncbi:MAG: DUF2508 domain-containing protein [Oscillospiraceae bacterium]|nr:DUF2508 domain-containing protein [Oscillospiraceae bacterium]